MFYFCVTLRSVFDNKLLAIWLCLLPLSALFTEFRGNLPISSQLCVVYVCNFRLGKLLCLADPEDLLVYKGTETFSVIQDVILNCTHEKHMSLPSHLVGTDNEEFFIIASFMCQLFLSGNSKIPILLTRFPVCY